MKNKIIKTTSKYNLWVVYLIIFYLIVIGLVVFYVGSDRNKDYENNNYTSYIGKIKDCKYSELDSNYYVYLDTDSNIFVIPTLNNGFKFTEDYLDGYIKFKAIPKHISNTVTVDIIEKDGKEIFNITEDFITVNRYLIIFGLTFSFCCFLTILILELIKIKMEARTYDFITFSIKKKIGFNRPIAKKGYRAFKTIKRYKIFLIFSLTMIALMIVSFTALVMLVDNKDVIEGSLFLVIVISLLLVVLIFLLSPYLVFSKRKRIKSFISDYMKYLRDENVESKDNQEFNEEGILLPHFNEVGKKEMKAISYDDLNLFAVALYSNDVMMMRIFICSNTKCDTSRFLDDDIVFELNGKNYKDIKKYNVNVNGLDELINNMDKELRKHIHKKGIVNYLKEE